MAWRAFLVLGLLTGAAAPAAAEPLPAEGAGNLTVTLISTGRRAGLVRAMAAINSPTLLLDRYLGTAVEVSVARSGRGVFAHRGRYLFLPRGVLGVEGFRAALAGLRPRTAESRPIELLKTDYTVIFQDMPRGPRDLVGEMWAQNGSFATVPELARGPGRFTPVDSPAGELALVEARAAPLGEPLPADPEAWERLDVLVSRVADAEGEDFLYLVKRPLGDPARMLTAARELRDRVGASALLLDPGTAWPSHLPAEREQLVLRSRVAAKFDAVLPSPGDLAAGPAALLRRAGEGGLPLVAANLWLDGKPDGLPGYRVFDVGVLRVGVVGLLSPLAAQELPTSLAGSVIIGDPSDAAGRAISALGATDRPPDIVVLLCSLDPAEIVAVREKVTGADVVIGDFSRAGLVAPRSIYLFPDRSPGQERSFYRNPSLVVRASPVEVVRVDLTFEPTPTGRAQLRGARVVTVAVNDDVEPDPGVARGRAAERSSAALPDAEPLLPPLADLAGVDPTLPAYVRSMPDLYPTLEPSRRAAYPLRFTDSLFTRMAVNLVREAANAEVAAIRPIVRSGDAPGEVTAGEVDRWLEGEPDRLAIVDLPGAALLALRAALRSGGTAWSGIGLGDDGTTTVVAGRPVLPGERYRVALGDSLLARSGVAVALGGVRPQTLFSRLGPGRFEPDSGGEPVPIRRLIPDALWRIRQAGDLDGLVAHLRVRGTAPRPGLRVRLSQIDLRGGDLNQGSAPGAGGVDPRLASARASAVGTSGEVAVEADGEALIWETYGKFTYDGQFPQGTSFDWPATFCAGALNDDWVVGTEVRNRRWAIPMGFAAIPYVGVSYDSQFFCPPRQKLVFLGTGVRGRPGPIWQDVRLGVAIRRDLEHDEGTERPPVGAQLSTRLEAPLGAWKWRSTLAADYFPTSPATALELDATWTNALDLEIGGGLSWRVKSELLGFAVGEGAAEGLRHSLTFGLSYDRTLKPTIGLY